jgi:hypothetical protein
MTNKNAGGRITGLLALTCEAAVSLKVGDHVQLSGPYTVTLADGTVKPLGRVSVSNKKRVLGGNDYTQSSIAYGVAGEPVTVEVPGFAVMTHPAGAAITAGAPVGINGSGALVAVAAGAVNRIGTALTTTTAAGQSIDYLLQ